MKRFHTLTVAIGSIVGGVILLIAGSGGEEHWSMIARGSVPELRAIAAAYSSLPASYPRRSLLFLALPVDAAAARTAGTADAAVLKAYADAGIRPYIVYEPSSGQGLSPDEMALAGYIQALYDAGVRTPQLGTVVIAPEANTPAFGPVMSPEAYGQAVVTVVRGFRLTFPRAELSALLDSRTYPVGDTEWHSGKPNQTAQYAEALAAALNASGTYVDSVGLQGFPRLSNGAVPTEPKQLRVSEYLSAKELSQLAALLGVHTVWFNTGTFSRQADAEGTFTLSPAQRQRLLHETLEQAQQLKAEGLAVTVNIFAEDKSKQEERIDWSYRGNEKWLLQDVLASANHAGIGTSLYLGLTDADTQS